MRLVTLDEYLSYVRDKGYVTIEGQRIELRPVEVSRLHPLPEELTDVSTTVWSFPRRGSWATHRGDYRGNWPPQMVRALILRYTEPGETVVDPMVGSGTTCVEARLLGRNCVAVDVNYEAAILTLHRVYHLETALGRLSGSSLDARTHEPSARSWVRVYHGDARRLDKIEDCSADMVATHPPYWGIIEYGGECSDGNLSCAGTLEEYLGLIGEVARELYRVLKPGRVCAILIGDTRVHKHYVPISHHVLEVFLDTGFVLMEEVVKVQHKMKATRELWSRLRKRDFLLIYHEKLYVFRKPHDSEDLRKHRYSARLQRATGSDPGGGGKLRR